MYTGINQYHVVMELKPEYQQSPAALNSLYVPSTTGTPVPLSAFTHYKTVLNSLSVNHQGPFPSITLSFALAPGIALSQAVDAVEQAEQEIGMPANVQRAICRHRAGVSSLLEEPAGAHSRRRCWRSTSSWGFSMKATFTPSPSCLPCPPRA